MERETSVYMALLARLKKREKKRLLRRLAKLRLYVRASYTQTTLFSIADTGEGVTSSFSPF